MPEYTFTVHARDMLREREISEELVSQALNLPDEKNMGKDGNMHYFKSLPERGKQVLHVVVNENVKPYRIVTLFLDRRRRAK